MSIWILVRIFRFGVVFDLDIDDYAGEWDHFLYVGKIAFFGWIFHFGELRHSLDQTLKTNGIVVPFLIMGRVTYLHHYVRSCARS